MLNRDARLAIAAKVAAAGIFYQDAYEAAAMQEWNATFPITDIELGEDVFTLSTFSFQDYLAARRLVEAELRQHPRGTWTVVTYARDDGHIEKASFMSNGAGGVYSGFTSRANDYRTLAKSMAGMEIYESRREFERQQTHLEANKHLATTGWRVGTRLRNVRVAGAGSFTSALITDVTATGFLDLLCTRRGSRKRWRVSVLAQGVSQLDEEARVAVS